MLSAGPSVRVSAPCRADLAGGTLDIWPLGVLHPGALTVNMAVPLTVELTADRGGDEGRVDHIGPDRRLRRLGADDAATDLTAAIAFALAPSGGLRVRVERQAPYRSGIGGSSAYGVALACGVAELVGTSRTEAQLVALVRDLEARVLGVPTGEQDHWAAIRGGVNALHLEAGGHRLEPLVVDPDWLRERSTVFYSGIRHRSGMVNWQVIRRRLDGDRETVAAFDAIMQAARACRRALLDRDDGAVAAAIAAEWRARRRLAPEVCPAELERLIAAGLAAGATAVKATGAGGGGSLLVWHEPATRDAIAAALESASDGGRVIAAGAAETGLTVTRES